MKHLYSLCLFVLVIISISSCQRPDLIPNTTHLTGDHIVVGSVHSLNTLFVNDTSFRVSFGIRVVYVDRNTLKTSTDDSLAGYIPEVLHLNKIDYRTTEMFFTGGMHAIDAWWDDTLI